MARRAERSYSFVDLCAFTQDLFRSRDWPALRSLLHPEFCARDHRALRIMPAEQTGEEWVASEIGFTSLATDVDAEPLRIVSWNDLGAVMLYRVSGTSDGSAFENVLLNLIVVDRTTGEMVASELFDVDDVQTAVTRLGEYRCGRRQ